MKSLSILLILTWSLEADNALGQSFKAEITPFIQSSCIHCHDTDTDTGLNLESIDYDLSDSDIFRQWERLFDRVNNGEMPPETEDRPDPMQLRKALGALGESLRATSLAKQERAGRVPARRLTKLEVGHTLRDLLSIGGQVEVHLPDENESGSFDTVGSAQRISAVHMESYLKASDEALGKAIQLSRNPFRTGVSNFSWLEEWHDKPLNLGGSVTRKLDEGIALFADVDYLTRSQFDVATPGVYRLMAEVAAYQSREPVTLKVILKEPSGAARLLKAADLEPDKTETIEVSTYLNPGDTTYLTFDTGRTVEKQYAALFAAGGSKKYRGKGITITSQKVEGPLSASWPPVSTRRLLCGTELVPVNASEDGPFKVVLSKDPIDLVTEICSSFAPQAFRRPLSQGELESFVDLAKPAIEEGRNFVDALRITLRSMLNSPQFLMFDGAPGKLDDYALANRLSYFLWKSMPDDELFAIAADGKLTDSEILKLQVDRMLNDEKLSRFVRDFLGQWLRLYKINATTPDEKLYPEYDELLGDALRKEPELFFKEIIKGNLSVTNLVDSNFTYLNRRLATHYGIPNVAGQQFRKVYLPDDSPRGGFLTQAAILKTTANGTVTSPVMRGNFVLTNLLGTPPAPPPPSVGSIEPDTRGKTTIREILAAHRNIETCNTCHRKIDPPGFALESFDPIGGFRSNYRANATPGPFSFFLGNRTYKRGPVVDPSGVTADGKEFLGITEFKQLLLNEKEQVARNFISRLVVYATGGEIQFADRDEIESLLDRTREDDFPVRDIIHNVVQSRLFRHK